MPASFPTLMHEVCNLIIPVYAAISHPGAGLFVFPMKGFSYRPEPRHIRLICCRFSRCAFLMFYYIISIEYIIYAV